MKIKKKKKTPVNCYLLLLCAVGLKEHSPGMFKHSFFFLPELSLGPALDI